MLKQKPNGNRRQSKDKYKSPQIFKMVKFLKDNECRSAWDSTGSTNPIQTKLQKQNYQ